MTSTQSKPVLQRSYDLDLSKNQMLLQKVPQMQNFKSFGPWGAELQSPSLLSSLTLLPPLSSTICSFMCLVSISKNCRLSNIQGSQYTYTDVIIFKRVKSKLREVFFHQIPPQPYGVYPNICKKKSFFLVKNLLLEEFQSLPFFRTHLKFAILQLRPGRTGPILRYLPCKV